MSYQFEFIKILVAEDNKPMQDIMKSLLQTFGVGEVLLARDGNDAYNLYCQHNPDIVIADWMMYPTDGIELCEKIRKNPESPNRYVPLILMTGYSERKRVFHARDAGVTEFIVKPFTAQELYKRLVQVIERPRQFVRTEDFFGPDRRRKIEEEYKGPHRREQDESTINKESIAQAAKELEALRKSLGLSKKDRIAINPDDEIDMI